MTVESYLRRYWVFYMNLERQVVATEQYVEFDDKNGKTFSLEYLKLLQLICSEIDVLAKTIVTTVNPGIEKPEKMNISRWGYGLQQWCSMIENKTVVYKEKEFIPWSNWKYEKKHGKNGESIALLPNKKTPEWWTAYNKVKHLRVSLTDEEMTNYRRATQYNVYQALTALFILEREYSLYIFQEKAYEYLGQSVLFGANQ